MAPRNDQPKIPTQGSRRGHIRDDASRTSPTAADEQATNVINSAIRRPAKTDSAPKPAPSSISWGGAIISSTRDLFSRSGNGTLAPNGQGADEEEKYEDEDDEVLGEEEGEMGQQNSGMGFMETEMSYEDPHSPSAQLQPPEIHLLKRGLRSRFGSVLPRQKAATKRGAAARNTHDKVPTDDFMDFMEHGEGSDIDSELPPKRVSAQTRAASRNPSLRAASKPSRPPKPKAKRKHQEEIPEPLDMPDEDPEDGASTDAGPVIKRAKITAKAPTIVQRPQRTRTKTNSLPRSSVRRSIEVVIPSKSTPKKRGRPPNLQPVAQPVLSSPMTHANEERLQDEQSLFVSPQSQVETNQGSGFKEDDEEQDQEDEDQLAEKDVQEDQETEGVTGILMNPSPVKPLRQEAFPPRTRIDSRTASQIPRQIPRRAPSHGSSPSRSRPTSAAAARLQQTLATSPDDDISEDESARSANEASDESGDDDSDNRDALFKLGTLTKMYKIVRQVGKTWNTEKSQFVVKDSLAEPTTDLCTGIFAALERLVFSYEECDFQLDETRIAIKEELSDLQGAIEEVILQVLCKRERNDESQQILRDLYFCILPELVHTILLASKVYGLSKDIKQSHLKELSKLSRSLQDLAKQTLQHGSSPRINGTKAARLGYRFSKPTKDISPNIRALYASLEGERSTRQQAKRRKEREKEKSVRAKERKEQQERDSHARKLRADEIYRLQKKSLEEVMADPIMNKLVTAEINKARVGSGQRQSSSKSFGRRKSPSSSPSTEEDQYYDHNIPRGQQEEYEDDDPELERVTVFGQNNNRQEQGPEPWTNEERAMFIDIMRGEDESWVKYQRTMDELDRDMDDVLSMAQDLQAVMDHEHSNGRLNGAGDLWTYHIWNLKVRSQN